MLLRKTLPVHVRSKFVAKPVMIPEKFRQQLTHVNLPMDNFMDAGASSSTRSSKLAEARKNLRRVAIRPNPDDKLPAVATYRKLSVATAKVTVRCRTDSKQQQSAATTSSKKVFSSCSKNDLAHRRAVGTPPVSRQQSSPSRDASVPLDAIPTLVYGSGGGADQNGLTSRSRYLLRCISPIKHQNRRLQHIDANNNNDDDNHYRYHFSPPFGIYLKRVDTKSHRKRPPTGSITSGVARGKPWVPKWRRVEAR